MMFSKAFFFSVIKSQDHKVWSYTSFSENMLKLLNIIFFFVWTKTLEEIIAWDQYENNCLKTGIYFFEKHNKLANYTMCIYTHK